MNLNFRDALLWVVIIFCGSLYIQFNIWWIIDTYFNRKEKHIQNALNVFFEAIKKISDKKEKE